MAISVAVDFRSEMGGPFASKEDVRVVRANSSFCPYSEPQQRSLPVSIGNTHDEASTRGFVQQVDCALATSLRGALNTKPQPRIFQLIVSPGATHFNSLSAWLDSKCFHRRPSLATVRVKKCVSARTYKVQGTNSLQPHERQ